MEKAFDRMRLEMGQRIRILRKRQIWSQEEFAERLGVSTITISRIENGTTRIDVQLLMNMAEVLQTKVTTILGTEEGYSCRKISPRLLQEITMTAG